MYVVVYLWFMTKVFSKTYFVIGPSLKNNSKIKHEIFFSPISLGPVVTFSLPSPVTSPRRWRGTGVCYMMNKAAVTLCSGFILPSNRSKTERA